MITIPYLIGFIILGQALYVNIYSFLNENALI